MAISDLADRFQALQVQKRTAEFKEMSYADLSQMRISFGETKVNQTFLEVIEGDPKYVQWFAKKYHSSQKEAHQAFLYFLNLYVERKELESESGNLPTMVTTNHLKSKAKAKPSPRPPLDQTSQGSWSEDETPWDTMSADQQATRQIQNEMAMTSNRLDNMETALMQITQQLQALTQLANNSKTNP
jgi:hypothetical protein